jgi:hypothetical protein
MKQIVIGVGSHRSHSVYALTGQMKQMVAGVGHTGDEFSLSAACTPSDVENEVTTSSSGFNFMGVSPGRKGMGDCHELTSLH